jgi:hypothetical protein
MIAQSNVTHMLVGKDLNILANTGTRADLATGQIGVFKVGSKVAVGTSALSAGDRFTIATKNSKGVLVETPVIEYSNVSSKQAVDYAAATQASVAIGFNGTAGSIDDQNSTTYVSHIYWYDNSKTFGYGKPVKFATYLSGAAATQVEIAAGLTANFNKNFSRETPKLIKAEVLINNAGLALGTGVDTITLKNGSKYFTATNIDDATTNAALAVGDYLRIGTAVTDPCYKVVAIDTVNNIGTLDTPYQGADYSALDPSFERIAAATAATSDAGVKLTALATTGSFQPGVIKYDVTNFEVELKSEFGSTNLTVLTNGNTGSGTYWEVAENEWFLKGNRGEAWRVGTYPKEISLEATSGKTYDQISISYATYGAKTIDRTVGSFGAVLIATEDASSGNIYASLKTVLGI